MLDFLSEFEFVRVWTRGALSQVPGRCTKFMVQIPEPAFRGMGIEE